jgi:tetratricopeptide (TPR) repeat protein
MTDDRERLLAATKESRLLIFAGAGVSMGPPTNLPSWTEVNRIVVRSLAASAARAIGQPLASNASEIILNRHAKEKLPPAYQAQILAEWLSYSYFDVLKFIDSDRPNASHLAIAWLAKLGAVRAIVTTNFDRLLERAFAEVGVPLQTHYEAEHFAAIADNLDALDRTDGPCHLFKLHGSVDNPRTLIDTLAQRKKGFPRAVLDCMELLQKTRHWVFLGFSGWDLEAEPNYLGLAQNAGTAMGFTWVVRENQEPRVGATKLRDRYGDRGVIVHGELPEWLIDVSSLISPEPKKWIDDHLAYGSKPPLVSPTFGLETGAATWANAIEPQRSSLALALLALACADPTAAVNLVQELLTTLHDDQDSLMKAVALNTLGILLEGFGRHEAALARLTDAVTIADRFDDDSADRFRINLAITLETLGRGNQASALYQLAIGGFRSRGEPMPLAFGLSSLARHHFRNGRFEWAEKLSVEALELATQAGDERLRITIVTDLGIFAKARGEYPVALDRFDEAERLLDWLGDDAALAAAMGNKGEVLAALGRFDEAESLQKRVLDINVRLERLDNQANAYLSLGGLEQARGRYDVAEQWFASARNLFASLEDPTQEAYALKRLASLKFEIGELDAAIDLADAGLPLVSGKNDAVTSDLWFERGRANLRLGWVGRAIDDFRETIVLAERVGATRVIAGATQNLGTCYLLARHNREAAFEFATARDHWRTLNNDDAASQCAFGEAAVQLDTKITGLLGNARTLTDWTERQTAAREIFELYPGLMSMYEQIGAMQLVATFCASAGTTAEFISEDAKAIEWFTKAGSLYRDMGAEEDARSAFGRAERLLQYHVNALMQRSQMEDAFPLLLQLADVSGQLGHREAQATAMYNAAIGSIQLWADYGRAQSLAAAAAELFDSNSKDADMARRLAGYCVAELARGSASSNDEGTAPI